MNAIAKKAVVVHSGGMDSSLCLAEAINTFGRDAVLSLSFNYNQRHSLELKAAQFICDSWQVDHVVLDITCLSEITHNALTDPHMRIQKRVDEAPNTLVTGRNGLMARIAAIHADALGAECIYMGVIEVESANSGYRDCTRAYMDLLQDILRIDLDNANFVIHTPLVFMTKKQTMTFGYQLGVLEFLLEHTVTCYEGIAQQGCQVCPACVLRNQGLAEFLEDHPEFALPYQ